MSLTTSQIRHVISIVRQHEVLYGSGISSGDAAVRDELDKLIGGLEGLLPEDQRRASEEADQRNWKRIPKLPKPSTKVLKVADIVSANGEKGVPKKGEPHGAALAVHGSKAKTASGKSTIDKAAHLAKSDSAKGAKKPAVQGAKLKAAPAKASPTQPGKAGPSASSPERINHGTQVHDRPGLGGQGASAHGQSRSVALAEANKGSHLNADPDRAAPAKAAVAKPTGGKSAGGNAASTKPGGKVEAMHLFDAYARNMLPKYGGYIVNVFYQGDEHYTIVEIIGYENLQDIYASGSSLVFKTAGCKLFALIEQPHYSFKSVEPVNRAQGYAIPYRFAELDAMVSKRYQTIYVGKKPVIHPTSFSIFKPSGEDFSVLFYDVARLYENIQDFLIAVMVERNAVPAQDARKAAALVVRGIHNFKTWLDS